MTDTSITPNASLTHQDVRQRFFIEHSPVRGDVVHLAKSYASIIAQKPYPEALKCLLGEMLSAASLLIGTLKIDGTLSIQLQSSDSNSLLNWAMAECDRDGIIRALASFKADTEEQKRAWDNMTLANEAFAELGAVGEGVLFINIQPKKGDAYQGIVERSHDNLADCLAHYQKQSAQIPTLINLASDGLQAGGILVQLLPRRDDEEAEKVDSDLWPRLSLLTRTIKADELIDLPPTELLYRLYNEEEVVLPEAVALEFGCTCSKDKCSSAILQIGENEMLDILEEQGGRFEMDCGFCGAVYPFDQSDIEKLFAE